MSLPTTLPYQCKDQYKGGRCKALFIGINYSGTDAQLNGCVNDVSTMVHVLEHIDYPLQEAVILVDDLRFPGNCGMPTYHNIIQAMHWLTKGAQPGDMLFLHYSGHGALITTEMLDENEKDNMDEAMVPVDYKTSGLILDRDIFKYLAKPLPAGARLTAVMDCCHSATLIDLPFTYTAGAGTSYALTTDNACCGDIVLISGCKDGQLASNTLGADFKTSSDVPGMSGGACTNALEEVLVSSNDASKLSFVDVLLKMKEAMEKRQFKQIPQLSCSKPLDYDEHFSLYGEIKTRPIDKFDKIVVLQPVVCLTETTTETYEDGSVQTTIKMTIATADELPEPQIEEAPEPEGVFEPIDKSDQFGINAGEWKHHQHDAHGYGLEEYLKKCENKEEKATRGWGAGREWYTKVSGENSRVSRAERRARGKRGRKYQGFDSDDEGKKGDDQYKKTQEELNELEQKQREEDEQRKRDEEYLQLKQKQQKAEEERRQQQLTLAMQGHIVVCNADGSPARFRKGASMYDRIGTFTIPTDEHSLREIYDSFDKDNNGTIDRAEFVQSMVEFESQMGLMVSPGQLKRSFEMFDTNEDGRLSFQEFQVFMLNRARQ